MPATAQMKAPGLRFSTEQRARCAKRNRLDALKLGVSAVPVRLYPKPPAVSEDATHVTGSGSIPATDEAALKLINARLAPDAQLTLDDVHLLYPEAANNNFISDRWMFLGKTSLRNIAKDAAAGVPFMNSHRTGSMSSDAELQYGTSFAGRYEHWKSPEGKDFHRTVMGVYMLKGTAPNGGQGPSTDDIALQIKGGVLNDVSVGFSAGGGTWYQCDVCGNDMEDYEDCPHVPGTRHKMTDEEIALQEERGVPGGHASYTLQDGHIGEVSAVYNGAVPGAGFRKAVRLSRRGLLSGTDLLEARSSYEGLAESGDFAKGRYKRVKLSAIVEELADHFGLAIENDLSAAPADPAGTGADTEPPGDGENDMAVKDGAQAPPAGETPLELEVRKLREDLAASEARREESEKKREEERLAAAEEKRVARLAGFKKSAEAFVREQLAAGTVIPADAQALAATHYQAALDDEENPVEGFSRVGQVEKLAAKSKAHAMFAPTGNSVVGKKGAHLEPEFFTVGEDKDDAPTDRVSVEAKAEADAMKFARERNARRRRAAAGGNEPAYSDVG